MTDATIWLVVAGLEVMAFAITALAGLKGWNAWLDLKHLELGGGGAATTAGRIEMADLKERIRKLEAIAACVDL